VNLAALPSDVTVRFVLGGKQGSLPTDLAIQAQGLGNRFHYVRIKCVERNACDFCIAFYLGEYLHANPEAECVILSKDKKGFDPLLNHLTAERGFKVRRVNSQKEAFREITKGTSKAPFEKLVELLKKEKNLPARLKGLNGKVKSWFPGIPVEARGQLVQRLFADGVVKESEKKALIFDMARLR
jgi:PIN domain